MRPVHITRKYSVTSSCMHMIVSDIVSKDRLQSHVAILYQTALPQEPAHAEKMWVRKTAGNP